jgi:hypothetical protein
MHLKKWQKRWERCIHAEREYFKGAVGPKLAYNQVEATVPDIMDTTSYAALPL